MIHDSDLLDAIAKFPQEEFDGSVYRVTGINADPTAFSYNGGRWAPPEAHEGGCSILYTSLAEQGAIAEVASYLSLLTPVPKKPLKVHTLSVSAKKVLKLGLGDFRKVGIDPERFPERHYVQTQRVGAALNFLGLDGLIAPSARWDCNNLMIIQPNHALDAKLEIIGTREVSHREWTTLAGNIEKAEKRFLGIGSLR